MLNKDKLITEYFQKDSLKENYLYNIQLIVLDSKVPLEGNSFYVHQTLQLYPQLWKKQVNLFWCGKQAKTRICEIGFNAGHSTMLMLLGRDTTSLDFTVFDIGHHLYTKPCLEYIKQEFPHINFEYIEGDSSITMPEYIKNNSSSIGLYEVVHVDGGHSEHCIMNDMKNADILVALNGYIIIDDTNNSHINKYIDIYLSSGSYIEVEIIETEGYPHRIIQKIK